MVTIAALQESVAVGGSKFQGRPCSTDLLPTQEMMGAVVSTMMTVWLHWAALPQASVAAQVRVALKAFPQATFVTVLTTDTFAAPLLSVADGGSKIHGVPHCTVLFVF